MMHMNKHEQEFEDELRSLFDEMVGWLDRREEMYPDSQHIRTRCAQLRPMIRAWQQEAAGRKASTLDPRNPQLHAQALRLAAQPGVHTINLYGDGIEFVGSPGDQDDSQGFITGQFEPDQVRVWTPLPVEDCRGQGLEAYPR